MHRDLEQFVERHRLVADAALERLAVEQLHDDELLPVVIADVVQRADVRVVERGRDARFALEALDCLRIAREVGRQHLDGDLAAEPRVLGAIDDAHAAAVEDFDDAVMRDRLADHGRILHWRRFITAFCPVEREPHPLRRRPPR